MSRNNVRFFGQSNLGFIPAWQFSVDPNVNPNVTAYMKIPEGWQSQTKPAQPFPITPPSMVCAGNRLTVAPDAQLGALPVFDSWWWTNRKKLVIGGVVLAGVGLVATLGAILR